MNGAEFVAVVELSGKRGRFYQVDGVVAVPGQTCEAVDPASLPWLFEQGLIIAAPAAPEGEAE